MLDGLAPEAHDRITKKLNEPWAPVRDLWGTSPEAVDGQRAMYALAGGPAPRRKPTTTDQPAQT